MKPKPQPKPMNKYKPGDRVVLKTTSDKPLGGLLSGARAEVVGRTSEPDEWIVKILDDWGKAVYQPAADYIGLPKGQVVVGTKNLTRSHKN
jgi:hypothetical protein